MSLSLEGGANKCTQVEAERQLNSGNVADPEHDLPIVGSDVLHPLDEVDNTSCDSSAHTARNLKAAEAWSEIKAQFVPILVEF